MEEKSLDELIQESVKKGYIEGFVIQKLMEVQNYQNIVSNEVILDTINSINDFRNDRKKVAIFKPYTMVKKFSELNTYFKQKYLAVFFVDVAINIFNNLGGTDIDKLNVSLKILRSIHNIDYSQGNEIFFNQFNQMFYHSKRLMNITVSPYIINKFFDINNNNNNVIDLNALQFNKIGIENDAEYTVTFNHNNIPYTLQHLKKPAGGQFGSKVIIKKENEDIILKTYYLKTYYGYPAKGDLNSDMAIESTSFVMSSCDVGSKNVVQSDYRPLNLKEPLVYKILESLDIGPKVHFIVNPYIRNGFYILTEDLNNLKPNYKFKLLYELQKQDATYSNTFKRYILRFETQLGMNYPMITSFTEIDLLIRFMYLSDLTNDGNIGYLVPEENKENKRSIDFSKEFLRTDRYFKILDFLVADGFSRQPYLRTEDIKNDIESNDSFYESSEDTKQQMISQENLNKNYGEQFLTANKVVNYNIVDNIQGALVTRKAIKLNERKEKFFFGKQALSQFEERLKQYAQKNGLLLKEQKEDIEDFVVDNFGSGSDGANDLILRHLLQTQSKYVKDLMLTQRGETKEEKILRHPTEEIEIDGVRRLRNRTNAELIGFKNGKAPEDVEENKERLKYLDNAFEDLDTYCNGIVYNYKTLKTFIEDGYNQYFDNEGNLREVE